MTVRITELTASHLAAYKALRLKALRTEPDAFAGDHDGEAVQDDAFHLARLQFGTVYGAFDGAGAPAGMAGVILYPEGKLRHKASIWGVYVDPAYRGRGIARALMLHALAALPPAVSHVSLSVEENNKAAIALYESLGFRAYGLEPGAFRNGDILHNEWHMVRVL